MTLCLSLTLKEYLKEKTVIKAQIKKELGLKLEKKQKFYENQAEKIKV